jgi:thiamine-monophosphate kinase
MRFILHHKPGFIYTIVESAFLLQLLSAAMRCYHLSLKAMPRESEIISLLRKRARATDRVIVGIGDDAAVMRFEDADVIACCDLLVEGVHFRSEWAAPELIGHKALAVTLSDVAAMGGVARFAMVSLAAPATASGEYIERLFRGIFDLAETCDVAVVGGDTSSSPGPLFIDTSAMGECARGRAVTRAGAQPGDQIFVTGALGGAALGLILLERGYRVNDPAGPDSSLTESLYRRQALLKHLAPTPLLSFGAALGQNRLATAMIDISDGLSTDLWHVLDESDCGAVIGAAAIPVADYAAALAQLMQLDALQLALNGGEEYELLFTARSDDRERIERLSASLGVAVTAIGEIVADKELYLDSGGKLTPIRPSGYEHFI